MHLKVYSTSCIVNCPDLAQRRGHGFDMQSLGNNNNCYTYGRNFFFATSNFFERFCSQIPKVKYCHEFTKGNFTQSSLKEVTYYIWFDPVTKVWLKV